MSLKKYALGIEYIGTDFCGWQSQTGLRCVQSELEKVLSKVANESIEVVCAGRTDTGVHARGQVVHFETSAVRNERGWLLGANTQLPKDVSVAWVREVSPDFHARFMATARTYHYQIINRLARSAVNYERATWVYHPLDAELMHQAAQCLVGEHDFTSFRTVACQAKYPQRNVHSLSVERSGEWISCKVTANAFLHHMVRNIVGSLIMVGQEERSVEWLSVIRDAKDRTIAGPTAPADGLYLHSVTYPEKYLLPTLPS